MLLRALQRELRLAALGYIACDLGKAHKLGIFIANRVDDDVCPELGSVLAKPPALDRHNDREALVASERRFRLLVNSVVDYAIYMLDPSGIITNWNAGAARIKGYTAEEVVGTQLPLGFSTSKTNRCAEA